MSISGLRHSFGGGGGRQALAVLGALVALGACGPAPSNGAHNAGGAATANPPANSPGAGNALGGAGNGGGDNGNAGGGNGNAGGGNAGGGNGGGGNGGGGNSPGGPANPPVLPSNPGQPGQPANTPAPPPKVDNGPALNPNGPDFVLYSLPECTVTAGALTIYVAVRNSGPGDYAQLIPWSMSSNTGLSAAGRTTVSTGSAFASMHTNLRSGDYSRAHQFTITADPANEIVERNESNNTLTVTVRLPNRAASSGEVPCTSP